MVEKYKKLEFVFNNIHYLINRHSETGYYKAIDFKQISPNKEPKCWKDKLKNQHYEKLKKI